MTGRDHSHGDGLLRGRAGRHERRPRPVRPSRRRLHSVPSAATPVGRRRVARRARTVTGRHEGAVAGWNLDVVTGWCSVLLVLGLYLGGWNQQASAAAGGPSLTFWHGALLLGFVACAVWVLAHRSSRAHGTDRLTLVGSALALVAVGGGVVWALAHGGRLPGGAFSLFHLGLVCGGALLASATLRGAWSGPGSARVAGLQAFWPVVLSSVLVVAVVAYGFQDVVPAAAWGRPAGGQAEQLAGLLAYNLLFVAPVLLLLRRWRTPLGTFAVLAGAVAVLLATRAGFALLGLAGAAVLGGAAADVAVRLLRPSPQRPRAVWAVAVAGSAVHWTAAALLLAVGYGAGRAPQGWLGPVGWAVLSSLALALLAWPPALPLTAWNRGRARTRTPGPATATGVPARMVGR